MSRSAQVELDWADGTYQFRLPIGQLAELQDKCDAGPQVIMDGLANGEWKLAYIRETIRLGLIGGGKSPSDALKLVSRYVDARPLAENRGTAFAVIAAAVIGVADDPLPKREGQAAAMTDLPGES